MGWTTKILKRKSLVGNLEHVICMANGGQHVCGVVDDKAMGLLHIPEGLTHYFSSCSRTKPKYSAWIPEAKPR